MEMQDRNLGASPYVGVRQAMDFATLIQHHSRHGFTRKKQWVLLQLQFGRKKGQKRICLIKFYCTYFFWKHVFVLLAFKFNVRTAVKN